ncbi:MAG: response regulator [Planctomycetes bacterium]|nr:response regulator [Planctomycetota bacterium]
MGAQQYTHIPAQIWGSTVVTLLSGIACALVVCLFEMSRQNLIVDMAVERRAEDALAEVGGRVRGLETGIRAMALMLEGQRSLGRQEIETATARARAGTEGQLGCYGFIARVPASRLLQFYALRRFEHGERFSIDPVSTGEALWIVQSAEKPTIAALELGATMEHDTDLLRALEKSVEDGLGAAPEGAKSVPDDGVLLFAPVMARSGAASGGETPSECLGVAFAATKLSELLPRPGSALAQDLHIQLISEKGAEAAASDDERVPHWISIGGRRWMVEVTASERFASAHRSPTPWILFGIALALTAISAVWSIGRNRNHASLALTLRERTEQLRASRRDVAMLSALVCSLDTAALATDRTGAVVWASRGVADLLGSKVEELLGTNATALLLGAETNKALAETIRARIAAGESYRWIAPMSARETLSVRVEVAMQALRTEDGEISHFVFFLTDVTSRLHRESEILRALEKAREESAVHSIYVSKLTQEMRTPLNGIRGLSHLLADAGLEAELRDAAATIEASCESLVETLDSVSSLSSMARGEFAVEEGTVRAGQILEEIAASFAQEAADRGIELYLDMDLRLPMELRGDALHLRKVMSALADNALKFTCSGYVAIGAQVVEDGKLGPAIELFVEDSGSGISKSDCARVFEPFERGTNRPARPERGSGLGLSLAKALVERMGGQLLYDSTPGEGTRVAVRLRPRNLEPQSLRLDLKGKRVLVVDDHERARAALATALRGAGAVVDHFAEVHSALEKLRDEDSKGSAFHLVVLDVDLPERTGLELVEAMRAVAPLRPIPVVALVKYGQPLDPSTLRRLGIRGFLEKPFGSAALLDAATAALRDGASADLWESPRRGARPAGALFPGHARKALIVDDDAVCGKVASSMLKKLGFHTRVAASGAEALAMLATEAADVVLMDVSMPELDGCEVTRRLRASEGDGRRTPVLAVTAHTEPRELKECREAGMDAVLTKPLSFAEIQEAMQRWAPEKAEASASDPPATVGGSPPLGTQASQIVARLRALGLLDNPGTCEEAMRSFVSGAEEIVASAQTAIESGSKESGLELSRRLRRVSSHFGAQPLAALAHELEAEIDAGRTDEALAVLEKVESEFVLVRQAALDLVQDPEGLRRFREPAGA